jgi:hypothetical protein
VYTLENVGAAAVALLELEWPGIKIKKARVSAEIFRISVSILSLLSSEFLAMI